MKLLSDQVDSREINIVVNELKRVINSGVLGDVVEFGCYVGTTSVYMAEILQATARKLYVYDSFEGLPDKTTADKSALGEQFKQGELCATKKELISNFKKANLPLPIIKKAWFSELTAQDVPADIAFAFLDGDYYESIRSSLKLINSRLSKGATIIVDDYANDALPGAKKAVDEWLVGHSYKLKTEHSLAIIYT